MERHRPAAHQGIRDVRIGIRYRGHHGETEPVPAQGLPADRESKGNGETEPLRQSGPGGFMPLGPFTQSLAKYA